MKKIIFALVLGLSFSNGFAAGVIRIYNQNPQYGLFVNYQACFRDFKNKKSKDFPCCLLPIFNITIPKGQNYIDVTLPDYLDYARIVNAYDLGEDDAVIAEGEFLHGMTCLSWPHSPSVSLDNRNSSIIHCTEN